MATAIRTAPNATFVQFHLFAIGAELVYTSPFGDHEQERCTVVAHTHCWDGDGPVRADYTCEFYETQDDGTVLSYKMAGISHDCLGAMSALPEGWYIEQSCRLTAGPNRGETVVTYVGPLATESEARKFAEADNMVSHDNVTVEFFNRPMTEVGFAISRDIRDSGETIWVYPPLRFATTRSAVAYRVAVDEVIAYLEAMVDADSELGYQA